MPNGFSLIFLRWAFDINMKVTHDIYAIPRCDVKL